MFVLWDPICNEFISDRWTSEVDHHICSWTEHLEGARHFATKENALDFVRKCETKDCPEVPKPRDAESTITRVYVIPCTKRQVTQTIWSAKLPTGADRRRAYTEAAAFL